MKRTLSIILAAAMILALFTIIPITSAGALKSGVWEYALNGDGTATVTGRSYNDGQGNGTVDLNIPSTLDGHTVTAIGEDAFTYKGKCIRTVTIPNTVKTIGDSAFSSCRFLTSVKIPTSVKTIGYNAFFDCDMSEVTIPKSVTSIGVQAFGYIGYYVEEDGDWLMEDDGPMQNFTIKGYAGSAAEKYAKSNYFKFTTLYSIAPPKIGKLENVNGGVKITIGKVSGVPRYRVFYNIGKGWVKAGDTTTTTFTFKSVSHAKKYTFTVRGLTKDAKQYLTDFDHTGWAITYIAAPKAPTLKNTKNGVQVTYTRVSGVPKYALYRKAGSAGWQKVATINKAYVDKTAKNGVTYRYTLRCMNKNGKLISGFNNGTAIKCKR